MSLGQPRRQMARPVARRRTRDVNLALMVVGLLIVAVVVGGLMMLSARAAGSADSSPTPRPSAAAASAPSGSLAAQTARPTAPATPHPATTPPRPMTSPTAVPNPSATVTLPPDSAPTSAAGFDLRGQVIDIGFPLRADTTYHYRDNWLDRRDGPPNPYNHARVGANGQLIRLHDGIDIYGPEGAPVLAPFDGTIIDPATRWSPWEPDRYGLTVVVESDEPGTAGYMAVLVHLERVWVDIGQHVTRGQVLGALGRTGDAQEVAPQLHFELRAPFLIDWSALGEDRQVDAFNPYPSLVAADPNK